MDDDDGANDNHDNNHTKNDDNIHDGEYIMRMGMTIVTMVLMIMVKVFVTNSWH